MRSAKNWIGSNNIQGRQHLNHKAQHELTFHPTKHYGNNDSKLGASFIHLRLVGTLRADFHANLGTGFDGQVAPTLVSREVSA